jgi:hypothetical protein
MTADNSPGCSSGRPGRSYWRFLFLLVIVIVLVMADVRFIGLENVPPGFFVDEAAAAANVLCLRETGAGELGDRWPLFFAAYDRFFGAFFTAPYIYPLTGWTLLFGESLAALRSFSAFISVVGLAGLFALGSVIGDRLLAWLCLLVGALSPTLFQFSRIAWDPAILPCLLVWALFFTLRSNRPRDACWGALLFALAAYSYPPARAQLALLLPALALFKCASEGFNRSFVLAFLSTLTLVTAPLVYLTLTGELNGRFRLIGVFAPEFLQEHYSSSNPIYGLVAMAKNLYWHLTPQYLFFKGDNNLRHGTQLTGVLGALEILAIVFLLAGAVRSKSRFLPFGAVCVVGYLAADLASAATYDSTPNALRAIGGAPFAVLLAAMILREAIDRFPVAPTLIVAVAYGFTAYFLWAYFVEYPPLARRAFMAHVAESAHANLPVGNWPRFLAQNYETLPSALHYYLMAEGHQSCRDSAAKLLDAGRLNDGRL